MSKNDRPLQIPFDRGEIFVPVLGETIEKMFLFCYIHSKGCNLDLCFLVALQKRSTYHCVSSLFLLL